MPQVADESEDLYALLAAGVTAATSDGRSSSARYGERLVNGEVCEYRFVTGQDFLASQVAFAEAVAGHITEEDIVVVAAPYDLSFIGHVAERALEAVGATLLGVGTSETICPMPRTLGIMRRYGATVLVGAPQVALELSRLDRSMHADALHTLRTLVFIGGTASPRQLERTAELWGADAVQVFGSALLPTIGIPCPSGEIHLSDNRSGAEIDQPSAARIAPGGVRGELRLLARDARRGDPAATTTGELVELRPAMPPCDCGGTGPVVIPLGPLSETLATEHGRLSPVDVERVAHSAADLTPDLRCDSDGTRFRLTCTPGPRELRGEEELARRLKACLRADLEIDVHVVVRPADAADPIVSLGPATRQRGPVGGTGAPEQTPQPTEEVVE